MLHCEKCGTTVNESWKYCNNCNTELSKTVSDKENTTQAECAEITGGSAMATALYICGLVVIIGGIFAGVQLGNYFAFPAYLNNQEPEFNLTIAASIWVGSFLNSMIFFGIGSLNNKANRLTEQLNRHIVKHS